MSRLNGEVPNRMFEPDMAGGPTSEQTPERKLVPEGPLQAERQAFMDAAREVLKERGYGLLRWTGEWEDEATHFSVKTDNWGYSFSDTKTYMQGEVSSSRSKDAPYRKLSVIAGDVEEDVMLLTLQGGNSENSANNLTYVWVDPNGQVIKTKMSSYELVPGLKRTLREVEKGEGEDDDLRLVLKTATSMLTDLKERPEWKTKPKGPFEEPHWEEYFDGF